MAPDNEAGGLQTALKRHFGFDHFRPGQEAVAGDALAGRDLLADAARYNAASTSLAARWPELRAPSM